MANAIERLPAFLLIIVLQRLRFFAVRKILVSIFDRVCNGGALREIYDLAGERQKKGRWRSLSTGNGFPVS
ncbi:hypothetical protein GZ353_003279 [Salmonella enterica]|uniref:hypothetical protein n=1 Tax=Citrobacter cronae TaxID=1748967 RepID=UPI001D3E4638|nr:hypothetical protein [Citrobacter cronae]EAX9402798.1 hypothetical protein [Salmonella enterica]EEG3322638.1 hypothetical protein [Salmonella enterica]EII9100413.1 hypothetical protein [Salmonella enterica]